MMFEVMIRVMSSCIHMMEKLGGVGGKHWLIPQTAAMLTDLIK